MTMVTSVDELTAGAESRVQQAIRAVAAGKMVVVTDDADREDEGDLVMAADAVTAEAINFMVTHGRGLVCVPMEAARLDALGLRDMVPENTDPLRTGFTVSVDLDTPGSTGISALDRAATVHALLDPRTARTDLRTPGHVFPLRAASGGVLTRRGHTEASVDLARLAGRAPAGVICEILAPDGTMLRGEGLAAFAEAHSLVCVSIDDLARHRLAGGGRDAVEAPQDLVQREVETVLPTRYGTWRAIGYTESTSDREHLVLLLGTPEAETAPLVRIHSECLTGDTLASQRCDCGDQLDEAFRQIHDHGSGVIIYVRGHEGRGIGLVNKLRAYALQDTGLDTVDANVALGFPVDARDFSQSAGILRDLGLPTIRLLTNNPDKVDGLTAAGIRVVERVPSHVQASIHNAAYLSTKRARMAHAPHPPTAAAQQGRSACGDSRVVS